MFIAILIASSSDSVTSTLLPSASLILANRDLGPFPRWDSDLALRIAYHVLLAGSPSLIMMSHSS